MNYEKKYLKYKTKYIALLNSLKTGGALSEAYASEHDGYKTPTEDRHTILTSPDKNITLLAVFDGHGGSNTSNYVNEKLPNIILPQIIALAPKYNPQEIEKILSREFVKIDDIVKPLFDDGSTGTVCIVTPTHIITANIGDSPAILFTKTGDIIYTTNDHDCSNNIERERVSLAGNPCLKKPGENIERTISGLAPTRGFGDGMRHDGVISKPETYIWEIPYISYEQPVEYILCLCSDSFTEQINTQPKLHIGPYNTRQDIVDELNESINTLPTLHDAVVTAVIKRVDMFKFNNMYYGDNTTLILMNIKKHRILPETPANLPSILKDLPAPHRRLPITPKYLPPSTHRRLPESTN